MDILTVNSDAVKALLLLLDSHNPSIKTFIFLTVRPISYILQAERRSLSKETPQNFQYLTEVVEIYFYNVARFVIFHLDPSNYQTAFQGIP